MVISSAHLDCNSIVDQYLRVSLYIPMLKTSIKTVLRHAIMWEFELTFSPLGPPEPTGPTAPGSPFWLNEKKYVRILRLTLVHFVLKIYVCATYWPVVIKQLKYTTLNLQSRCCPDQSCCDSPVHRQLQLYPRVLSHQQSPVKRVQRPLESCWIAFKHTVQLCLV